MKTHTGSAEHYLLVGSSRGLGKTYFDSLRSRTKKVSGISRTGEGEDQYKLDIRNRQDVSNTVRSLVDLKGPINHLIFFLRFRGPSSEDSWQSELDVSLTGVRNLIKITENYFQEAGNRTIIFIGSTTNHLVNLTASDSYHVAKAGMHSLMKYYAVVLATKGIRCNMVSPGILIKPENAAFYRDDPGFPARITETVPLNRPCEVSDVTATIEFLTSEGASYITGNNIVLDGGASLARSRGAQL